MKNLQKSSKIDPPKVFIIFLFFSMGKLNRGMMGSIGEKEEEEDNGDLATWDLLLMATFFYLISFS